jgi:hypothetical protein
MDRLRKHSTKESLDTFFLMTSLTLHLLPLLETASLFYVGTLEPLLLHSTASKTAEMKKVTSVRQDQQGEIGGLKGGSQTELT